jgi:hypothetical protein
MKENLTQFFSTNKVKRKKTWTSTEFTNIEDRKLRKGCMNSNKIANL